MDGQRLAAAGGTAIVQAPAKLNLHLGIHPGRDERGYHRADSVMCCIALADLIRIEATPGHRLRLETSVDCGVSQERNTAYRAAALLCDAFERAPAYRIRIEKHIPSQAGLGGASSDAGAVLRGLCALWGVDLRDARVVEVARRIGADVPFFLTMAPALLTGAGDVLEESFPKLPSVPVVLARPDVGVSTPAAYAAFDEAPTEPASPAGMCAALRTGAVRAVAAALYNNLEPAANRLAPVTAAVHAWLANRPGVLAAQMTGSGSCVFALCESDEAAAAATRAAQAEKWWSRATKTLAEECPVVLE